MEMMEDSLNSSKQHISLFVLPPILLSSYRGARLEVHDGEEQDGEEQDGEEHDGIHLGRPHHLVREGLVHQQVRDHWTLVEVEVLYRCQLLCQGHF